jgi:hypothetical protein
VAVGGGLALSFALAIVLAPMLLRTLRAGGASVPNFRGRPVLLPTGVLVPLVGSLSAVLLAAASPGALGVGWGPIALYVAGVAALGAVDDAGKLRRSSGARARGLRGHARAARGGRPTTGLLKAGGTLALAPLALASPALGAEGSVSERIVKVAVLVLTPHVFNLLDLRPGRSIKALLALGALLVALGGVGALLVLGVFLGPVLVLLAVDLGERGMLGDAGSGAVGALAGVWLVIALPPVGEAVALGALLVVTLYGEHRSISSLVERTRVLREIDRLGGRRDGRGVSLPR